MAPRFYFDADIWAARDNFANAFDAHDFARRQLRGKARATAQPAWGDPNSGGRTAEPMGCERLARWMKVQAWTCRSVRRLDPIQF